MADETVVERVPEQVPDAEDLAVLADVAELAYFQVDGDRNIVAVSPALERITGFAADEVVGRSCLTLIRCHECLRGCGVFEQRDVKDVPLTLYRADGTTVDVLKSGRAFVGEDERVVGALETVRLAGDVASPTSPPPELDTLLGALGRYFVVADEAMRIVGHSAGLPDLTGEPAEALRQRSVSDLLGGELFAEDSPFRRAALSGERLEGWRASMRLADGGERAVSVSIGPIPQGTHCGAAGARLSIMIRPEAEEDEVPSVGGIIARSRSMQRIFRVMELLRDNDSTVLITGESGTGKELVARAIHDTSHRKDGPFVAVNCAALPAELLESELFGHVRGAFTGAVRDKPGRFELADGGTLFLDEIGDLALPLQAKLLRALQEHAFERVGDTRTRHIDVRVIAATHMDLVRAVSQRTFREDLYYRLRVVPIEIPPLRERREDLELLIRYLLERIGKQRGRALRLAQSAVRALLAYPWPGNVRELENALEYATTVCEGQTIHVADLPAEIERGNGPRIAEPFETLHRGPDLETAVPAAADPRSGPRALDLSPEEADEVQRIRHALQQARYRRAQAAEILGVSRTTLWRKMKQYRI